MFLGDIMHKLDWEYSQERLGPRACLIRGISFGNLWEGRKNSDIGVSEKAFQLMKVFIVILGSHEEHGRNFWDHLWHQHWEQH
jgi:hypothetical protein